MAQYEFINCKRMDGDPIIRRVEGTPGVLDFIIFHVENPDKDKVLCYPGESIYYNGDKNKAAGKGGHNVCVIPPKNWLSRQIVTTPDEVLNSLSSNTGIPLEELVAAREVARQNATAIYGRAKALRFSHQYK